MDDTARPSTCEPCAHARRHGHWGDTIPNGWTHSKDSHISFPGTQVWGECTACSTIFRGEQAFDKHHESGNCPPPVNGYVVGGQTFTSQRHDTGFDFYAEDQSQRGARIPSGTVPGVLEAPQPSGVSDDAGERSEVRL